MLSCHALLYHIILMTVVMLLTARAAGDEQL
jgi:hypothetical protein